MPFINKLPSGGGGVDDANLTPANIRVGVTIGEGEDAIVGTFSNDANAAAAQILTGYSGYVNGAKVSGTMEDCSKSASQATTFSVSGSLKLVYINPPKSGYYITTKTISVPYADLASKLYLTAAKLVAGNTVMGVAGTAPRYELSPMGINKADATVQRYNGSSWVDVTGIVLTNSKSTLAFNPKVIRVSIKNTQAVTTFCYIYPDSQIVCYYTDASAGTPPEIVRRDANASLIFDSTTKMLKLPLTFAVSTAFTLQTECWE